MVRGWQGCRRRIWREVVRGQALMLKHLGSSPLILCWGCNPSALHPVLAVALLGVLWPLRHCHQEPRAA